MTDNYCKRKTSKHLERTDDEYAEALRTTNNIRTALLKLGINSSAGYYYDKARSVMQMYNIDQSKNVIHNHITYTVNHECHTVSEWASILGVNKNTFRKYIAHLSDSDIELAISKCIENIGDKQYIRDTFLSMKNINRNVSCNKNKDIEKNRYCDAFCHRALSYTIRSGCVRRQRKGIPYIIMLQRKGRCCVWIYLEIYR